MKRVIFAILVATFYLTTVFGQETDSIKKTSSTSNEIEFVDTPDTNHKARTTGTIASQVEDNDDDSDFSGFGPLRGEKSLIAILAVTLSLTMPIIIVFIVLYFRYKNKQARYRLAEQALAAGQPIPDNLFNGSKDDTSNIQTKGIKNIFVGLGLFIFLWAISEEFSLACIGLLVMFTGFGQLAIYHTQNPKKDNWTNQRKDNHTNISGEA